MPTPNPYDFVPLEATSPVRQAWDRDSEAIDRYHPERFSGRMVCRLIPETPLFIHGEGQQARPKRAFNRIGNRPAIHASSIKGALRSIYEIVTDGCMSALSEQYRGGRGSIDPARRMPAPYTPCHDMIALCPACRLFGMVETSKSSSEDDAAGLAGRLLFSDAFSVKTSYQWRKIPAVGGGPQPRHGSFYFQDGGEGQVLGRKLYYHHADYEKTIQAYGSGGRPGLMEVELHTSTFEFSIDFINLAAEEVNFLCYVLLLEESVRHHLGFGKPYGLGSARIVITEFQLTQLPSRNPVDRFLRLEPPPPLPVDAVGCAADGKAQWLKRAGSAAAYQTFRQILAWPGRDLYQYPDYRWFRQTEGTGEVTLAEYQRGTRSKSATPAPRTAGARLVGRVDTFNDQKGFGFILAEDGQRLFVHFSDIRGQGRRSLQAGQRVEFEVVAGNKGPKAQDVVVIEGGQAR